MRRWPMCWGLRALPHMGHIFHHLLPPGIVSQPPTYLCPGTIGPTQPPFSLTSSTDHCQLYQQGSGHRCERVGVGWQPSQCLGVGMVMALSNLGWQCDSAFGRDLVQAGLATSASWHRHCDILVGGICLPSPGASGLWEVEMAGSTQSCGTAH